MGHFRDATRARRPGGCASRRRRGRIWRRRRNKTAAALGRRVRRDGGRGGGLTGSRSHTIPLSGLPAAVSPRWLRHAAAAEPDRAGAGRESQRAGRGRGCYASAAGDARLRDIPGRLDFRVTARAFGPTPAFQFLAVAYQGCLVGC